MPSLKKMAAGDENMKEDVLGQFEQLVLTAVLSLGEDAYGPKIHEKVIELAERTFRSDRYTSRWTVWKTKATSLRSRAARRNGADRPVAITDCALPASGPCGRRLKLRGGCSKPPNPCGNSKHE